VRTPMGSWQQKTHPFLNYIFTNDKSSVTKSRYEDKKNSSHKVPPIPIGDIVSEIQLKYISLLWFYINT